jgi:hypothetical protein
LRKNIKNGTYFLWLDRNVPYFTNTTGQIDNDKTNPFHNIPFVPGGLPIGNNTMPEYALYSRNKDDPMEHHLYLMG